MSGDFGRGLRLAEEVAAANFIPFSTGRAQISSGVIHVLRDLSPAPPAADQARAERESVSVYELPGLGEHQPSSVGAIYHFNDQSVVLLLAIPMSCSPVQLIAFLGVPLLERVERIRLLRDAAPNRYMALIRFDGSATAHRFLATHGGRAYSPLAPECCHALLVSSVEFTTKASLLEPLFDASDFAGAEGVSSLQAGDFVQIPTCPVCLERIDGAATGVLIVVCQHKFHCQCLERWGDGRCPVCRFLLRPAPMRRHHDRESTEGSHLNTCQCSVCGVEGHIWLCLICGHAGCGRYDEAHAHEHYLRTGHNYALEVATHRVWDYLGDK